MDTQKQSIVDRIKQANNILVTVSKNPSVDQLAAAIGVTLALNKIGKHAIAVFSGEVPSTLEFLKPEDTFEKTTDSLRDFIISLDKAKADKLRYKVEDQMVKIFITPYRTSITDKDLVYSQGEFNVEVVVALGVLDQQDLDDAITAQGRILHDATVVDINTGGEANLGTLIWSNPKASSLCEMVLGLIEQLKAGTLDAQMSTAILTGIVAETERFSNAKTSPEAMQASSKLMAAGANQQLVATELAPPPPPPPEPTPEPEPEPEPTPEPEPEPEAVLPDPVEEPTPEPEQEQPVEKVDVPDALLTPAPKPTPEPEVPVESVTKPVTVAQKEEPKPEDQPKQDGALEISHNDNKKEGENGQPTEAPAEEKVQEVSQIIINDDGKIILEAEPDPKPPSQASSRGLALEPPTLGGQLTANTETERLDPSTDIIGDGAGRTGPMLSRQPDSRQTLSSLEEAVNSPHLDAARSAVDQAGSSDSSPSVVDPSVAPAPTMPSPFAADPGLPKDSTDTPVIEPVAPPPVPPPMMPPNFVPPSDENNNSL